MYGWRARIGLLYPASGLVDQEFHRLAPPGVSVYLHRVAFRGEASVAQAKTLGEIDNLIRAAKDLQPLRPNCVAWACTSGSFAAGKEACRRQIAALEQSTGAHFTNTSQAMVRALGHLGVKRVGVGTPYPTEFNAPIAQFLEDHGFEVVAIDNLGLKSDWEVAWAPPETIYSLARRVAVDRAEAVFLACTGLAALDLVDPLERDLKRPVLIANQVTMWDALRLCGISTDDLAGFGVLFSGTAAKEFAGASSHT